MKRDDLRQQIIGAERQLGSIRLGLIGATGESRQALLGEAEKIGAQAINIEFECREKLPSADPLEHHMLTVVSLTAHAVAILATKIK